MLAALKPYPAMKDSGVESLGEIPEHWDIRKLRQTLKRCTERNRSDLPLLSVVREKGVILRDMDNLEENHNFIPDDLSNYKVVREGQFAMNKMKAWQGSYGVSSYEGIVSPAYFIFDLSGIEGNFFHAAIRSRAYVPDFTRASDGVRIGQWDLAESRMREICFATPPIPEQTAIVRYLDYVDRRVRRLVRAKRKLITLLKEQKQAIIHRAVTLGLDPNVPLKDSGIKWLGKVPEHWLVTRVKNEFFCLNAHRLPLNGPERGAMTSREYDYYGASGAIDKVDNYIFDDELLLIAEDGANLVLRNLPLAIIARGKFWVNNHAHILKPKKGNLRYLAALMELLDYRPWISGAAQPKLTKDRIMAISIIVAPPCEQDQIIEFILSETDQLSTSIIHTEHEIKLLNEYRIRLIADVVTGKLDVREAAAALPKVDLLETDASDNILDTDIEEMGATPEEMEA